MLTSNSLQESRILRAAFRLCGFAAVSLLTACVSSNLTDIDSNAGTAVLELELMSSSHNSTRCLITYIDGEDMLSRQSPRLTVSYIVPAGTNLYTLNCQSSLGSIPMGAYSFEMLVTFVAGKSYVLLQEFAAEISCIRIREKPQQKALQAPIAEFCSPIIDQSFE